MVYLYKYDQLSKDYVYYLTAENYSRSTIANYLSDLRHFLNWICTKSINPVQISLNRNLTIEYLSTLSMLKNKTYIKRRLSSLRVFFSFANKNGYINTYILKELLAVLNDAIELNSIRLLDQLIKETVQSRQKTELKEIFNEVFT